MILVEDILEEVAEALGVSTASSALIYRRINRAVEMLSAKGDWDPLLDTIDVCVQGTCLALPPFVSTVLGLSVDNIPYVGRDRHFEFHTNGPGRVTPGQTGADWRELGRFPCQYEIGETPGRLIAVSDDPSDTGSLLVYGLGSNGLQLSTIPGSGATTDGISIPINSGYAAADVSLPEVLQITRVRKPITKGRVRLYVDRGAADTSELLGRYEFNDQNPSFLRLSLGTEAESARVFFRHKTAKVDSSQSAIRLHNTMALINAVKAVRYYLADDPEQGQAYEAIATRMLQEQEIVLQPPTSMPMTMSKACGVFDPSDRLD